MPSSSSLPAWPNRAASVRFAPSSLAPVLSDVSRRFARSISRSETSAEGKTSELTASRAASSSYQQRGYMENVGDVLGLRCKVDRLGVQYGHPSFIRGLYNSSCDRMGRYPVRPSKSATAMFSRIRLPWVRHLRHAERHDRRGATESDIKLCEAKFPFEICVFPAQTFSQQLLQSLVFLLQRNEIFQVTAFGNRCRRFLPEIVCLL